MRKWRAWNSKDEIDSLGRSAVWFRQFYKYCHFRDVDELLSAGCVDSPARVFIQFALDLRWVSKNRIDLESVIQHHLQGGNDPWFTAFRNRLWSMYLNQRELAYSQRLQFVEDPSLRNISQSQRQVIAGTGLVTKRRMRLKKIATQKMNELADLSANKVVVAWLDNFAVQRYARNPNEFRDRCINGTVFAMLAVPMRKHSCDAWPTVRQLVTHLNQLIDLLPQVSAAFGDDIRNLDARQLTWEHVRVPVDIRRKRVTSTPWYPFDLVGYNISSTVGLVDAVAKLVDFKASRQDAVPLLADVNIHYRITKAVYSLTNSHLNIAGSLRDMPVLFGVWHAYAHLLRRTREVFMSVWSALEYPVFLERWELASTVKVYNFPKLITLEHMVVGLYLTKGRLGRRVALLPDQVDNLNLPTQCSIMAQQLKLLLTEYVPALMYLGIAVRDLAWKHREVHTGDHALKVLLRCLVATQSLEKLESTEYPRALTACALLWSPTVHSLLPGNCFVEEPLEASFSRLADAASTDLRAHTTDAFSQLFQALGPPRLEPKDLVKPGISKLFHQRLDIRIEKLCGNITTGRVYQIMPPNNKAKFALPYQVWVLKKCHIPKRLMVPSLDQTDFKRMVMKTVKRLVSPKKDDDSHIWQKLDIRATPLSADTIAQRTAGLRHLLDVCNQFLGVQSTVHGAPVPLSDPADQVYSVFRIPFIKHMPSSHSIRLRCQHFRLHNFRMPFLLWMRMWHQTLHPLLLNYTPLLLDPLLTASVMLLLYLPTLPVQNLTGIHIAPKIVEYYLLQNKTL